MTISEIAGKDRGRSLIYLNDEPAFVLKDSEVRKLKLKEGEEIPPETYGKILEILNKRAKSRTLHILDRAEKTENELRKRLSEDLYPPEVIEEAVEAAKSGNFLNDERYAAQYIYAKSGKKSKKQIRIFLSQKGIDENVIDAAFSAFEEERAEEGEDPECVLILKLIKKRWPHEEKPDPETEQKLYKYLMGKGFEYGKIRKVMRGVTENRLH